MPGCVQAERVGQGGVEEPEAEPLRIDAGAVQTSQDVRLVGRDVHVSDPCVEHPTQPRSGTLDPHLPADRGEEVEAAGKGRGQLVEIRDAAHPLQQALDRSMGRRWTPDEHEESFSCPENEGCFVAVPNGRGSRDVRKDEIWSGLLRFLGLEGL